MIWKGGTYIMKNRIVSLLLALCMLLTVSAAAAYDPGPLLADMQSASAGAAKAIEAAETYSGWNDVLALYSAGAAITASKLPAETTDTVSGLAAAILMRIAAGGDPYAGGLPYELALMQQSNGSFGLVNEQIYAMLALDRALPAFNQDKAMAWLLSQQLENGSFAFDGVASDADLTAMALLVIRGDAAEKAGAYLTSVMTENGGFVSPWSETKAENACTVATVISGFVAAGLPVDEKMKANLLSFRREDGAFCFEPGGDADVFATQQALVALGDLIDGTSVYADLGQQESRPFRDWDSIATWARSGATTVYARDLMVGDNRMNFNPLQNINRAELAVIASKLMKQGGEPVDQGLSDVRQSDWYYSHASRVVQAGIMTAYNGRFDPLKPVTREEMALVLFRLLELVPGKTVPADADEVGEGFLDAVSAMIDEGIMVGNGIIFMPKSKITRQEVATTLAKLYA